MCLSPLGLGGFVSTGELDAPAGLLTDVGQSRLCLSAVRDIGRPRSAPPRVWTNAGRQTRVASFLDPAHNLEFVGCPTGNRLRDLLTRVAVLVTVARRLVATIMARDGGANDGHARGWIDRVKLTLMML